MLSYVTPAIDVAAADAYANARGYADWTGTTGSKTAALRRGQDYIAGRYNYRWLVTFTDADAPDAVKYAIVEAARRELKSPGSLTPDVTIGKTKVLTEVKGIKWTLPKSGATKEDMLPYVEMIRNLLRGYAEVDPIPGAITV